MGSYRFGFRDLAGRGELGVEGKGHGGSQDLFPMESLTLAASFSTRASPPTGSARGLQTGGSLQFPQSVRLALGQGVLRSLVLEDRRQIAKVLILALPGFDR